MRKIFLILSVLFCSVSFAQNWNTVTQGSKFTYTKFLGAVKSDSAFILPTISILTNKFKDTIGSLARYNDSLYFRSAAGWINLSRSGTTDTNYLPLTFRANKYVNGNYKDWYIDSIDNFVVQNSNTITLHSDLVSVFRSNGTVLIQGDNLSLSANHTYANLPQLTANKRVMYNSSTGELSYSDTTTIAAVTSVATGLGLSGGTITNTGTLLVDTASTSIISRQRAAATYQPISTRVFVDSPQQVFPSGNIAFTGTTAPSGTTNNTYRWSRMGNLVTIRINMSYSVAATGITQVTFTFPSDMPLPENNITGYTSSTDNNSPMRVNGGNSKTIINPLSANINYETGTPKIRVNTASQNIQYLQIQGSYFTNN